MPRLQVHFLPELVAADALAGSQCVVIDVLRATTTMIHALAAGARSVIPCLTIDEARRVAGEFPAGEAVLGGERHGVAIEGFDLGNSPTEYSAQTVGGKTVVLTTTNGTKALLHCQQAAGVLIAGFVNLSAVCARLRDQPRVDLVCAGTDGQITREDVLLAGAIAARLSSASECQCNDQAAIAADAWQNVAHGPVEELKSRLIAALRSSQGGRNLLTLNMHPDLESAAQIDRFAIVPEKKVSGCRETSFSVS